MGIIERLKDFITSLGFSESEFAASISVGQRSLNYYLKGQQKPGLDIIVKISETLISTGSSPVTERC